MKTIITIIFLTSTYFWGNAQCVTNLSFKGDTAFDPTNSKIYNGDYYFKSNDEYSEVMLNAIKDRFTPNFWISEMDIIDNHNIIYRLPTKRYRVKYK